MKLLYTLILCLLLSNTHAETLVVGTSSFNPPMEMQATLNGVFTGFEIDLLNEVCRRIGATCVYKPMTFKGIMDAVAAGRVDLGIDGFFITRQRLTYYLFSQPYLQTKAQLFARTNSSIDPSNINTGKRIGVETGTIFKSLLTQMYDNIKVVEYDNQQTMLQDLNEQRLDLIMFDFIGASYWVNNNPNQFKFVGEPIAFDIGYGIMANLNRSDLIGRINSALQAMENDGSYVEIYSRYFFTP